MEQTKAYVNRISLHFDQIPILKLFTDKTGVPSGYLCIGILISWFLLVISKVSPDAICDFVGILYPGYMSFRAIETK